MKKIAHLIVLAFLSSTMVLSFQNCAQNYGVTELDTPNALHEGINNNNDVIAAQEAIPDIAASLPDPDDNSVVTTMPVPEPTPTVVIPRDPDNDNTTTTTQSPAPAPMPVPTPAPSNETTVTTTSPAPAPMPAPVPTPTPNPGNTTTTTQNPAPAPMPAPVPAPEPSKVVCDPFSTTTMTTVPGIKGELYYLTQGTTLPKTVFDYFKIGKKADVAMYFSQLKTPTRNFEKGFPTSAGGLVKDDRGNALFEYFAFNLKSNMKLGANDPEGIYQLALLSDDGAVLDMTIGGTDIRIVDNDGTHATRMGCANRMVKMTKTAKVPMKLYYYQGPRVRVALMLKWRLVAKTEAEFQTLVRSRKSFVDKECGQEGDDYFFESSQDSSPETSATVGLTSRGWKTLAPDNFEMQEGVTTVVCKANNQ